MVFTFAQEFLVPKLLGVTIDGRRQLGNSSCIETFVWGLFGRSIPISRRPGRRWKTLNPLAWNGGGLFSIPSGLFTRGYTPPQFSSPQDLLIIQVQYRWNIFYIYIYIDIYLYIHVYGPPQGPTWGGGVSHMYLHLHLSNCGTYIYIYTYMVSSLKNLYETPSCNDESSSTLHNLWLGNMTFTLLDPPKLFTRIYGGLHHTAAFPKCPW